MTTQSTRVSSSSKSTTAARQRLATNGDRTRSGSALHTILSDGSMLYAAIPAFAYAVLTEAGAQGVDDHDRVAKVANRENVRAEDVFGRLIDSIDMVVGIAFASDQERALIAHAIREAHRHIEGTMPDGSRYHAWSRELWALSWAGIFKPMIDAYDQLHGPMSPEFLQDGYMGFVQLGDMFGVQGLPDTYPEFLDYWQYQWIPASSDTGAARFIFAQAAALPLPRSLPWMPRPAWNALTWPVREVLRSGTFIVMDPQVMARLGIEPTTAERFSVGVHRRIWRTTPPVLTRRWMSTFMKARLRYGNTAWKRGYSPESLTRYRDQVKEARGQGLPDPPRPSVRR